VIGIIGKFTHCWINAAFNHAIAFENDHGTASVSLFVYSVLFAAATSEAALSRRAPNQPAVMLAQVRIQRTTIIRVPPASPSTLTSEPVRWKEKGGPDCIKWSAIAAAMISSPTSLDVIIRGGKRYRVKLNKSCQATEFYADFYVKATPDGQICRSRDSIYSRAGGECGIAKFRTLSRVK
jgi:hypothetical protein